MMIFNHRDSESTENWVPKIASVFSVHCGSLHPHHLNHRDSEDTEIWFPKNISVFSVSLWLICQFPPLARVSQP